VQLGEEGILGRVGEALHDLIFFVQVRPVENAVRRDAFRIVRVSAAWQERWLLLAIGALLAVIVWSITAKSLNQEAR
jgi:hypothetical protein